jgi:hypothetical protein
MKAISDAFRLWLSLRPAQRVGGVTSCFWGFIFLVILMVDLTTQGTLAPRTFTWIAVIHGALVSQGLITFFLYPGRVPRLPGAVSRGLFQGTLEILIVAGILGFLSTWARMVGLANVSPLSDFLRLLAWSGLSGLGVYLGWRFCFTDAAKFILSLVAGWAFGFEFVHLRSAYLLPILMVVLPIVAFPPAPVESRNRALRRSPKNTDRKGLWGLAMQNLSESNALFPRSAAAMFGLLLTTATVFLIPVSWATAILVTTRGKMGLVVYWGICWVFALVCTPAWSFVTPREVVLPGLMGFSRSCWARQHVFFRMRIWLACGLGFSLTMVGFASACHFGGADPEAWRSTAAYLAYGSLIFLFVLGVSRVFRYLLLDPFRLQLRGGTGGLSRRVLKNLGWNYAFLILLSFTLLFIMLIFGFGYFFLSNSGEILEDIRLLEHNHFLTVSLMWLILAVASWALSFFVQYRAILTTDLV